MNKIKLYRSEQPFWLVDASCGPKLGLSICSGDADAEWYTKVAAEHLDDLLVVAFGSTGSNPYTPIKEFLANAGVPFTSEFWGSM